MRKLLLPALVLTLALAACGRMGDLRPAPGEALPVKPVMAHATPTAADLLTPPAYAVPDRVDELMRRSAPRASDRFDLPPPNGGAPDIPVEATDDDDETTDKGPVKPT